MSLRSTYIPTISRVVVAAGVVLGLLATMADARPGRSSSVGSRGERTFTAPPTTNTAPKQAAPMEKSMTQAGQAKPAAAATAATAASAQVARPSMMRNLLLGGLLGAGLATLFGAGALANVLGFLLQGMLIAGLVYLAVMFFRGRTGAKPAMAMAGGGTPSNLLQRRMASAAGGSGGSAAALNITGDDYSAFERLLGEVQREYGRGDVDALGNHVTPEMLSYFAGELEDYRRRGERNVLGVPKLLQGDLSEAWSEAGGEYATVAMRYTLTDAVIDARSSRVISGSSTEPQEVTEVWTFRRDRGTGPGGWELSAIQQA